MTRVKPPRTMHPVRSHGQGRGIEPKPELRLIDGLRSRHRRIVRKIRVAVLRDTTGAVIKTIFAAKPKARDPLANSRVSSTFPEAADKQNGFRKQHP